MPDFSFPPAVGADLEFAASFAFQADALQRHFRMFG
jgi:hypothetical protein